jgi:methionyl-tRNA formyltransferase
MKIVFFGTPYFVLPIIETIHKEHKEKSGSSPIVAVVTQKPKPAGRKKALTYSAVDKWAFERNGRVKSTKNKIPILFDPDDVIKENIEADLGILAAYGAFIPKKVINYFPKGILNVHPSLLPKYRGASPIQATLVMGDEITGVSTIKLDEKLDHGPIISQFKEKVSANDTTKSLTERLFLRAAEVVSVLIVPYIKGKITPREQDHPKASFTTLIKKEHGFIDPKFLKLALQGKESKDEWEIPFIKDTSMKANPESIERFIKAMQPWPIAWTKVKIDAEEKRLKILRAHLENEKLALDEVQLEGKNPVSWKQFAQAYPKLKFT